MCGGDRKMRLVLDCKVLEFNSILITYTYLPKD